MSTAPKRIDGYALFHIGCDCGCECCSETPDLYRIEHEGREYITDRHVMVASSALSMGDADKWAHFLPITPKASAGVGELFPPLVEAKPRLSFRSRYVRPIYEAGGRIVPTTHEQLHAVVLNGKRVGSIMPYLAPDSPVAEVPS